ncbi:Methyl-accepting chemotaxis protein (MCP) signaling domain protein [compost metagenome]
MSTKEISGIVQGIQEEIAKAHAAVQVGAHAVDHGAALADEATTALRRLGDAVGQTSRYTGEVATAVQEQAHSSEQIVHAVGVMNEMTQQITQKTHEQQAVVARLSTCLDEIYGASREARDEAARLCGEEADDAHRSPDALNAGGDTHHVKVETMLAHHDQLKGLLLQAQGLNPDREARAIADVLGKFKTTLLAHLETENRSLYPALRHAGQRPDAPLSLKTNIHSFFDEMETIKPVVVTFLSKWDVPTIQARQSEFRRELAGLTDALGNRIVREEARLYPLYAAHVLQTASPLAGRSR